MVYSGGCYHLGLGIELYVDLLFPCPSDVAFDVLLPGELFRYRLKPVQIRDGGDIGPARIVIEIDEKIFLIPFPERCASESDIVYRAIDPVA